jgi:hypothetical protein
MENPKSRDRLMNVSDPHMCPHRNCDDRRLFVAASASFLSAHSSGWSQCGRRSFGQFANRYFRSFYFSWRNHVIRHGLPLAVELCSRGENVTRCPTGQENRNGDDTSAKGERGLIAQSQE